MPRRGPRSPRRTSWPSTGSGRARRARSRDWPAPRRRTRRGQGSARPGGCPCPCTARAAPRRRRCRRARCRGRSRSVPGCGAVRRPGTRRHPRARAGPATRPNWLNRSSWRAVFGGIHASGSKSSTWAATCERNADGSKRSIRRTGERAARSPARKASTPVPIGVTTPIPVTNTRRRCSCRSDAVGAGAAPDRRRASTASAIALNVASVRAGDRAGEEAVDERCPGANARPEVVLDRDPAAPRSLDPPRDVHPVRRAALVDEPEPAAPGSSTSAPATPPAGRGRAVRTPAVERSSGRPRCHRPPFEDRRTSRSGRAAAASAPRPVPARTPPPPAPDIDRDGALMRARRATRDRSRAVRPTQLQLRPPRRDRTSAAVRRAIDLVGQSSAGHFDAVQDAEEVQVGAARVLRGGVEVREDAFDFGDLPVARFPRAARGRRRRQDAPRNRRHRRAASTPRLGLVRSQAAQQDPASRSRQIA